MSGVTVITLTDCLLEKNTTNLLVRMGREYIMNKKYLVGKKPDVALSKRVRRLSYILTLDACLLDRELDCTKQYLNSLT